MTFDFSKLTSSKKPDAPASAPPQEPIQPSGAPLDILAQPSSPAPIVGVPALVQTAQPPIQAPAPANPLDGLFAASTPTANVATTDLSGTTTLEPLFGQGELASADQFPPLAVRDDVTDPEALEFLANINTLQQAMGNKAVIGESIRYIGEQLKTKPHLSAVLGLHPQHMGLTANALRSAYGLALGATVKRRTKTTKAKQSKAETFGALDSMMGDMDLSGITL